MRVFLSLIFVLFVGSTVAQTHVGCKHMKRGMRFATKAASSNADSVHVQHYGLHLDSVSFSSGRFWARAEITLESKVNNLTHVQLDLQGFTVDSVTAGTALNFNHDSPELDITVPSINTGETTVFTVHYHGSPSQDPSGWGGFYWSGNIYAYNMGVGFEEDPHVYGRAWYPCLDVFTDKSTYDFYITTDTLYNPVCNGELLSEINIGFGRKTTHWQMNEPIPTYLSAIAIANYFHLERTYSGIPATYACLAGDTANVISTFANMQSCVDKFLECYGPYRFNRIGYSLVPFTGGAMEHASSIHIGRAFIDGSLTYETLWAHELAHMWWGDNVTCTTAEDMWLNEGWAAYSEGLFTEAVYGEEAYMEWYLALHRRMLQFAHHLDGDYHAMNQIPHDITYGNHVYDKGPLMVHSMRGYMGDSLFFHACRAYQDSLEFGNGSSYDMRNVFGSSTGVDMTGFFDGFIFQPGWGHFSVDSFSVVPIPDVFQVNVHLRQRSRANQHIYEMNVPIYLADGAGNDTTVWVPLNQETQSFTVNVDFNPGMAVVDGLQDLSDAQADMLLQIDSVGSFDFDHTYTEVEVADPGQGGSILRIADNFVTPYPNWTPLPGVLLNQYHYWSVEGILGQDFSAIGTFEYNGSTSSSTGHMDNDLFINNNEDSLIFLYRSSPAEQWTELDDYTVETGGSLTNKRGDVVVNDLRLGEYVLAIRDAQVGIPESQKSPLTVYPNPASDVITIRSFESGLTLSIIDLTGRLVYSDPSASKDLVVDCSDWPAGTYLINLSDGDRLVETKKVEVR